MSEQEQTARQARAVLQLVAELHLRGYQLLRACPAMAPSGMSWRCSVAPASLVSPSHGALLAEDAWNSPLVAHYTSAAGDEYFGWTDAAHDTPSGLARRFIQRFPQIVEAGEGSDRLYSDWYVEMLHLTYPNRLPYAMADWETPKDFLPTIYMGPSDEYMGPSDEVRVPLPPPALVLRRAAP